MNSITIKIKSDILTFPSGASLHEIYERSGEADGALAAIVNNTLMEMRDRVYEDCEIYFINSSHPLGYRVYQRSAVFLLIYGVKTALGPKTQVIVKRSINKNLYFEITDQPDGDYIPAIESAMLQAVNNDLPIIRQDLSPAETTAVLSEFGEESAIKSLRYSRTGRGRLYKIDTFYDRIFGPVAPSAGLLKGFRLVPDKTGFYLQIQNGDKTDFQEIKALTKVIRVFEETEAWAQIMGVYTAGALNEAVCASKGGDIIRVNEALHEKRLASIADSIETGGKTVVLVAGPSSSGKTTFANRLSVQLRVLGITPHIISLDNYFKGAKYVPKDEHGQPDYESFDYLDSEQLNADLESLLKGDTVELPRYNFYTGEREYKGDYLKLGNRGALIVEGIHGLNAKLTESIPAGDKFKIFISALAQLNIDRHNRMPMSDSRLLRRIVRDMRTRGHSAARSLNMWESVQRGESRNIFPFQEDADAIFNSALVYELCILKPYVEPLLFGIGPEEPSHADARRLLSYLDSFVSMPPDEVPNNSIIREFIGGSCFSV